MAISDMHIPVFPVFPVFPNYRFSKGKDISKMQLAAVHTTGKIMK